MSSSRGAATEAAVQLPIARVMVDVALAHLDRPFDYLVSAELDAAVQAGSRVRVRFAGRLVDGYVLERGVDSTHGAKLAFIQRAIGATPVLTPETGELFRAVADRYAGSFVDVARLGIPPRHAAAEASVAKLASHLGAAPSTPDSSGGSARLAGPAIGWGRYRTAGSFLGAVGAARAARAVWSALPGEDWASRLAEVVETSLEAGRGAVLIVPDARDLARVDAALSTRLGPGRHVALSAELGPAERYRRWLAVRTGACRVVVGTRAAAYAPVTELGLLVIWDDGDDLHREPRAPYPDTRDVLALRSSLSGAALLIAGYARTAEAQQLVDSGWAHEIVADREVLRRAAPHIVATGDDFEQVRDPAARAARLPSLALRAAREAIQAGAPVLVQVPRRGYIPSLACARDRSPARCPNCSGPLATTSGHAIATCRWCGRPAGDWSCPVCGERRLRAVAVGSGRTAEELGRAFPGVPVRTSGREQVLDVVDSSAALVVSTPGAEPIASGGYGAALLLDGWAMLSRPDLRAAEETLRRWLNAAALVRPTGRVIVSADASIPAVQALIRWDPAGSAARELLERGELRFPPSVRMASLTGTSSAVAELVSAADFPDQHELIGPVPLADTTVRVLVRVPRALGSGLAVVLHAAAAARSARKAPEAVKVVLDPTELI